MKRIFKLMCVITFFIAGFANAQTKQKKVEFIHCKKFNVSVGIGVVTVDTNLYGCLVKVNGLPMMWWGKNANGNNLGDDQVDYIYVKEQELIKQLNLKDSKNLANIKIIKSGIWDYKGINYIVDTKADITVLELDAVKYYAFHLHKVE